MNDYNPRRFVPVTRIADDLSREHGRFVRVLRTDGGRVAMLRNYDDSGRYPYEPQIVAAFKTLVDRSPVVAFVEGHGERSAFDHGERGYGAFASNIGFRYALVNQGFEVRAITLAERVADSVDVVVVADMKEGLSEREMANFEEYVARGGNLLLMGEPRRQEWMNPLAAVLGLRFAEGIVVSPSEQYTDEVVAAEVVPAAAEASEHFGAMAGRYAVTTPSACAVEQIADRGFRVVGILASPDGSWIERQTTDFLEEKSTLDPAAGEAAGSYPVMLYLNRTVDGREQRIFVSGDADCLATSELTVERAGIEANNFGLVTELFRNFSYGEYPVEPPHRRPLDNELRLGDSGPTWCRIVFIGVIPFAILALGLGLWLARRGR
jgi:ABC-2 type transport system permease protein